MAARNSRRPSLGQAEPGQAQRGPPARAHRLGDQGQAQRRRRQHPQVHHEDQGRGRAARTGRTARPPAGRGRGRPCSRPWPPATPGGRPAQLGQRGGRRAGHQASRQPGQDPAHREHRHVGSQDEHDRAQRADAERHGQHWPAPGLIRGPARQQQGGQHAGRVHRVDHRHDGGGEMPLILVDDVQRGGQRGAEHGGGRTRTPSARTRPGGGRPAVRARRPGRGRQPLTAGVRTGVVHVSSSSSSPTSTPAVAQARKPAPQSSSPRSPTFTTIFAAAGASNVIWVWMIASVGLGAWAAGYELQAGPTR